MSTTTRRSTRATAAANAANLDPDPLVAPFAPPAVQGDDPVDDDPVDGVDNGIVANDEMPPPAEGGGGDGDDPDDGGDGDPEDDPDAEAVDDPADAPAALPAGPVAGTPFALTPSAAIQGTIDYSTRYGQTMYTTNTSPLSVQYDLDPDTLLQFAAKCKERAVTANWANITNNISLPGHQETYNVFDHFGILSAATLHTQASQYSFTASRAAQNSHQMFICLSNSLTLEAQIRVTQRAHQYKLTNANGHEMSAGVLYFKAITQCAQVDTVATSNALLLKYTCLDTLMASVDSDIKQFEIEANNIHLRILGRGLNLPEQQIIVNLFRGYLACTDVAFRQYMATLKDGYDDGSRAFTVAQLMALATNKYTLLQEAGLWNPTVAHDKKIVALSATVHHRPEHKVNPPSDEATNKRRNNQQSTSEGTPTEKKPRYPAWKKKAPAVGDPQEMTTESGKKLYWCPNHKLWVAHKPADCRKGTEHNATTSTTRLENNTTALQAIAGDDTTSTDSDRSYLSFY